MNLCGEDSISNVGRPSKLLITESAAYLFPRDIEHRDANQPAIWCPDDSAGNALAATVAFRSGEG